MNQYSQRFGGIITGVMIGMCVTSIVIRMEGTKSMHDIGFPIGLIAVTVVAEIAIALMASK